MSEKYLCDNVPINDNMDQNCTKIDDNNLNSDKHLLHVLDDDKQFFVCNGIYVYNRGSCVIDPDIQKLITIPQTEVQTEVQPEVQTEVQTEVQPEVQTEVQTEVQPEVQTEVQINTFQCPAEFPHLKPWRNEPQNSVWCYKSEAGTGQACNIPEDGVLPEGQRKGFNGNLPTCAVKEVNTFQQNH